MRTVNLLVHRLKEEKLTLALAESVTCGLAAHKMSTCVGVSDVLKGSIICYTPEVKKKLMGVPKQMIDECSCESMEVTETLAINLSKLIKADIHGAITGLASEGGSESPKKPVGTIFLCVRYKNKLYKLRKVFRGTPSEIKEKACLNLYKMILSILNK